MIEFERRGRGHAKTKYGLFMGNMPPRWQRIITENPIIKTFSDNDRILSCILLMEDAKVKVSHLSKTYINLETREISNFRAIKDQYKYLDWKCAFCKTPIKVLIHNYEPNNFTCDKCFNYYLKGSKTISQMVIDSSIAFTDKYKSMLREDQKKFIKYINKNDNVL